MRYLLIIIIVIVLPAKMMSQEWEVSEEKQKKLAPFAFTPESVAAGEEIFNTNCIICHGNPGQGNYQRLDPLPGDPAEEKIQSNSDGSIYYKVNEGHGLMPSFGNILSPDEIWQVVSYIRSFNDSYIQQVAEVQKLENVKWSMIKILLSLNRNDSEIIARVTGLENDRWTSVPDVELMISADRYFGQIELDEPKFTDENGVARFKYNENLKGDTLGNIILVSKLTDQELFGMITADTTFSIGMVNDAESLVAKRALWNSNRKAPLWLLASYISVVLTVWGLIFFVLFQLRRIFFIGKDQETDKE